MTDAMNRFAEITQIAEFGGAKNLRDPSLWPLGLPKETGEEQQNYGCCEIPECISLDNAISFED